MIFLVGGGGHARVCYSVCLDMGIQIEGCVTSDPESIEWWNLRQVKCISGDQEFLELLGAPSDREKSKLVIAIGDQRVRAKLFKFYGENNFNFHSLVHPTAILARDVKIGIGSQILAGVILQTGVVVGDNVIVNSGASVDHDSHLSNHCHVAPGAIICGGVTIGESCLVGAGSVVLPNLVIGDGVTIGAGAVVTKNWEGPSLVIAGNPAKSLQGNR